MDKMFPTVKVVTSVFNGEKYIKEQIDSVLNQTYPNIELYIRDNCSTDRTMEILLEYAHCPNVHIIQGNENIGFVRGYFTLLDLCGDADYYAYCDCDDVWMRNKLEIAVGRLEEINGQIPILYFSNYVICDENLNPVQKAPHIHNISFPNSLVDCPAFASEYVFNRKAKEMLLKSRLRHATGQDQCVYMLCQGMGKVIYDSRPLVKYRRHKENISASTNSKIKFMLWRIKNFLVDKKIRNIREQIQEYSDLYIDCLCEEDQRILKLFTRRNFETAMKKVFYPHMFRQNMPDEIMLRGLFLLGIL